MWTLPRRPEAGPSLYLFFMSVFVSHKSIYRQGGSSRCTKCFVVIELRVVYKEALLMWCQQNIVYNLMDHNRWLITSRVISSTGELPLGQIPSIFGWDMTQNRMSHSKRRETKEQPSRARSGHQISCCLVSLRFLYDILATITVYHCWVRIRIPIQFSRFSDIL